MKPETTLYLPRAARMPLNHCNLPASILGGLNFQSHPVPLLLDGVLTLHRLLFAELDQINAVEQRVMKFTDYMSVQFRLHALEEAGFDADSRKHRPRANYLQILKGWMFDSNQSEGAILKGWVESRFGLLPRWHHGPIRSVNDEQYHYFQQQHCAGLYNTNALEAQLDLLYTYVQYELKRKLPDQTHILLYRGTNEFSEYEIMHEDSEQKIVLFNNLSAFSSNQERADEFGDKILACKVPLSKIFFFPRLIPGKLTAEDEYIVIGGLYQCHLVR